MAKKKATAKPKKEPMFPATLLVTKHADGDEESYLYTHDSLEEVDLNDESYMGCVAVCVLKRVGKIKTSSRTLVRA